MYSILGLGDIAAPGLLIALMLRFDQARTTDTKGDKTYFMTCLVSYLIGLAVTIGKLIFCSFCSICIWVCLYCNDH